MQTFTYEEIREKALKQGVTDNRLRVFYVSIQVIL